MMQRRGRQSEGRKHCTSLFPSLPRASWQQSLLTSALPPHAWLLKGHTVTRAALLLKGSIIAKMFSGR